MSVTTTPQQFATYRAFPHIPTSATGERAFYTSERGDHVYWG